MGFVLKKNCRMDEIASTGFLFEHHTGARLICVQNNDSNKVFSVTFKTPPEDDRGAAHIVEHCVLGGSRKYPVKDPFNELLKGTLHTYLNAITFKDKTIYPVAGYHYPDFITMIDVYMDSVFYPLMKKGIFLQEGQHIDAGGKQGGIVYNEMSGAYSDPVRILEGRAFRALFPGCCYSYDAAGVPNEIAKLGYEDFLNFYKRYYTPENCYLYLYGDLDAEKMAGYMDAILPEGRSGAQIEINVPDANRLPVVLNETFSLPGEHKSIAGAFFVCGDSWDCELATAMRILYQYLLVMPNAPLKNILLEKGLGKEITGVLEDGIMQPVFGVICKDTDKSAGELMEAVRDAIGHILGTLDYKLLTACMNRYEFSLSEENYGYRPKGLAYNITMLTNWLYGRDPFEKMKRRETLRGVREKGPGYFKHIIEEYMLCGANAAYISLSPEIAKGCAVMPIAPTEADSDDLRVLEEFQNRNDSTEDLERIPLAGLPESGRDICHTDVYEVDKVKTLHHLIDTNGILYVDLMFSTRHVPRELLPYLQILSYLFTKVPTARYGVDELNTEIRTALGGVAFNNDVFPSVKTNAYEPVLTVGVKALEDRVGDIFRIVGEVINGSLFTDRSRIHVLLREYLSKLESSYKNESHHIAVGLSLACFEESAKYKDAVKGLGLYKTLRGILENYEAGFVDLNEKLKRVCAHVFAKNNLTINVACLESLFRYEQHIREFVRLLPEGELPECEPVFTGNHTSMGVIISSEVCGCAAAFDYKRLGYGYNGALAVLGNVLSAEYFMKEIRQKGGAYGCGGVFKRRGVAYFYSYRDPNIGTTMETFGNTWRFLLDYFISEREMRKYLIGAMNILLRPLHPSENKKNAIYNYFSDITELDLRTEAEEIRRCRPKEICAFSDMLKEGMGQCGYSAVGPESKIENYPFDVRIFLGR